MGDDLRDHARDLLYAILERGEVRLSCDLLQLLIAQSIGQLGGFLGFLGGFVHYKVKHV